MTKHRTSPETSRDQLAEARSAPSPSKGSPSDALPRRWSAARKAEVVIRLLKGESLDALAREIQQTPARISEWRERFLNGGEAAMKERTDDPEVESYVEEKRRLQAKVGQQAMEIELLYDRCHKLEAGLPPALRRSKR